MYRGAIGRTRSLMSPALHCIDPEVTVWAGRGREGLMLPQMTFDTYLLLALTQAQGRERRGKLTHRSTSPSPTFKCSLSIPFSRSCCSLFRACLKKWAPSWFSFNLVQWKKVQFWLFLETTNCEWCGPTQKYSQTLTFTISTARCDYPQILSGV